MNSNQRAAWTLTTMAALLSASGCAQVTRDPSAATTAPPTATPTATPAASTMAPGLVERGPGIERFLKIRTPGAATIARDGSLLVRDWPDGVFQLYRVRAPRGVAPVADAKAPREGMTVSRLTTFADGLTGYSLSPDGTRLLVMTAAGGNERNQVFLMDQANDDPATNTTPLLVNPQVVHSPNLWLRDNTGFIYTANDQSPDDFHILRYDFAPPGTKDKDGKPVLGTSTRLLAEKGSWSAADATRDGARLLVTRFRSASDSTFQELDAASGQLRDLTKGWLSEGATASISPVGYTPDEKAAFFLSDHESDGITRLYRLELATGALSKPLPALDAFELDGADINSDRTLLTVTSNQDGFARLNVYHLPGLEPASLPDMPEGLIGVSSLRGSRLVYTVNNARIPGLAFEYIVPALGQPANTPRQVTFADDQGIALASLPMPRLIKYKSFDGLEIPAFLYVPEGVTGPVPFVVDYHGGPEGQHRPGFDREAQYLLSEGFGVLLPNVRGSTGYGRNFQMMDNDKKRWDSVRDGVYAAQWLVDQGLAKPGHIATYGGSYGGFMATACLVEDSERVERGEAPQRLFGAGVNIVGIVNFRTFLERTAGFRRALREAEYGSLSDPAFLDSVSPLLRAEKINAPMLIAHGLNDVRVPIAEAVQLAEALQRRGLDPEQVYFHDEGHGFAKLENRLLFNKRVSRFLKQHVGME